MLPQQRLMFDHILAHPECMLFVEVGLGKTRAVLEAVQHLLTDGAITGVLVVAPLRVAVLTWPNEIDKWFPWMKVADLRTLEGRRMWKEGSAHIYVINYESLPKLCEDKGQWPVDMVVWDEIHLAKNPASKRIKAFGKHRAKFERSIGMSGTLFGNSHMDLFAPMRLIDGGERLGKVLTHFRERYFDSDYLGWNWVVKPWAKAAITEKIADITLTLKSETFLDIPPTTTYDVDTILEPEVMRQYKKLQKECVLELDNNKELVGVNAAALLGKLTQFCSGACYDENGEVVHIHSTKINALKTIVEQLGEPMLVATMYRHERERIVRSIPGAEEWGETSYKRWNAGKIKVLVVDPRSVGAGLNLQDGGRAITWFSQTYSHIQYVQMNARLARTGQTRDTFVYRLLCPQTVDWAIVDALRAKGEEQEGLKDALMNLRRL